MSLLAVDEALRRILADVASLEAEPVPLDAATGRILAEPLVARRAQPPFPASAMDGYAVRAADTAQTGARLTVVGQSAAGRGFPGSVGPGEAVRIFTGAPVPEGADAILIQENAEAPDGETIIAREAVTAARHVRPAGLDFNIGDVLLEPPKAIGPREMSLAAALGADTLPVRRQPRVAILATGNELVPPGATPAADQIFSSNTPGIAALVHAAGGAVHDLGIVRDETDAIEAAVDKAAALPADILVTTGGASVGEHDLVQAALEARGMSLDFWRIAMRPGKPLMFGRIERAGSAMRVLGLPGNPVSSLVCALLFLRPLIGALLGLPPADPSEPATVGADLPANDQRQDYLRASLSEAPGRLPVAAPLPAQDSAMLSTLATADCLLIRPPHAPAATAGDGCRIIRLP
jgi:molybdopterin molybdotransferase